MRYSTALHWTMQKIIRLTSQLAITTYLFHSHRCSLQSVQRLIFATLYEWYRHAKYFFDRHSCFIMTSMLTKSHVALLSSAFSFYSCTAV